MNKNKKILGLLTFLFLFINNSVLAQANSNQDSLTPNNCSWNQARKTNQFIDKRLSNKQPHKSSSETSSNQSRTLVAGLAIPSLWWAREQFDPFGGRLINNWLTFPQTKQINLIVNWQLWTLLDYLERYRLINQFGTVVREYGYNLRIFNQQKQCLATYEYNPHSNPPKWDIHLEQSNQDSLQIEPKIN
jgi:hypothetical protein